MDYKRIALFAALAVVSYLLLLQWNKDYPNGSSAPADSQQQAIIPNNDNPDSELLDFDPEGNTAVAAAAITSELASEAFISVSTPMHQVRINPVGGDIEFVALPKFPRTIDEPDQPTVLLNKTGSSIYISQSALLGPDGADTDGRPRYQSTQGEYRLDDEEGTLTVPLTWTSSTGVQYTKSYVFSGNDYLIDVIYSINNPTAEQLLVNMRGQIRRDEAEDPSKRGGIGGVSTFLGAALTTNTDAYKKVKFGAMEDGTRDTVDGGWISFSQHYFLSAWIPSADATHRYETQQASNGDYLMSFVNLESTVIPANGSGSVEAGFWVGPKDQNRLEEVAQNLNLTIDYGKLYYFAKPIFILLTFLNEKIGNFGWSIIAMTIVIKVALMYFSTMSYRSMAKMRKLTPHVNALKDRYGDDKQKLMQAQMELWRKEKVNPMGGCLPMLLQMPVLIGIYWVLNESVELRHAPWILWYQDLSAMDPFFLLPLVMGASMFISQLMTPMTTMDPMQAKMLRLMPVFFTIFFLWFPAGLVLYWLVSNVFNIAHQTYINKRVEKTFQPKHT